MKRKNFERVKAAILANPETLNMSTWGSKDHESPCGTVGCIAGFCDWLLAVDGKTETSFDYSGGLRYGFAFGGQVMSNAKRFLGITDAQASLLFDPMFWPKDRWKSYRNADTGKERAAIVVERIDYFLEAGQ